MQISIFGFGKIGKNFIENIFDGELDELVAIFDSNELMWGDSIVDSISVCSPQNINNYDFEYLIITSSYESEILTQISQYYDRNKIISINDYSRMVYTRKRYASRYKKNDKHLKIFTGKMAIYTAITGEYDTLNELNKMENGIDYVCFTNNKRLKSNTWNIEYISDNNLNNMYLAKKIKMFPNEYLSRYETTVWLDGKFQITGNLTEYISRYQRTESILCFPHFSRNCIYEEAARCIVDGVGIKNDIVRQISKYGGEKYPCDNGLYEMGCIVRQNQDELIIRLMRMWWNEVVEYSYRDQISFPYVCWKLNYLPDISDQNIYKNKWIECKRNYCKALGSF